MAFTGSQSQGDASAVGMEPEACRPKIKRSGYRKIRFRNYNSANLLAKEQCEGIIQWQPSQDSDALLEQQKYNIQESFFSHRKGKTQNGKSTTHPSPIQKLPTNGIRMDPFLSYPIKPVGWARSAVDYFVIVCSSGPEPGLTVDEHTNPHISLLLPFALQNSVLFESLVATCRASMLLCQGKSVHGDRVSAHHRGKALTELRARLQSKDCLDDATLLSIIMLIMHEYLTSNEKALATHVAGLAHLITLRGHLSEETPWDRFVKAGMTANEVLGSFVTGQPISVPKDSSCPEVESFEASSMDKPLLYPILPFTPDICTVLSRLPPGFSDLSLSGRISTQTIHVLASTFATHELLSGDPQPHQKCELELQNMLGAVRRLARMKLSTMESCLCCGLVAYGLQLRGLSRLNLIHDPLLRKLVEVLPFHEKPSSKQEQNCLIWISIAADGALALRGFLMPGSHSVLGRAWELYHDEMRSWEALNSILQQFFYTDKILQHWKRRWDLQMTRRRQPWKRDLVEAEDKTPTPEQIREHIRPAPRSIFGLAKAAKCPF